MGEVAGLLVADKPQGCTSHDLVEVVRRRLRCRAGHTGTLDPQATGVLLVCLGPATRLARFLQTHDKVYEGIIRLGWATATYDAEGEALGEPVEPPPLEAARVAEALGSFVGRQLQRPPAYSAKKVRGQPAYRRARRGESVAPEPVEVEIYAAELLSIDGGDLQVRVHCGPGTYVRTLAHELGEMMGCPAHLASLRRVRSGPFGVGQAVSWEELGKLPVEELRRRVVPPAEMLPEWPAAVVGVEGAAAVAHGRVVEARWVVERRDGAGGGRRGADGQAWVRVVGEGGELLAAGELLPGGLIQPRVVLAPQGA